MFAAGCVLFFLELESWDLLFLCFAQRPLFFETSMFSTKVAADCFKAGV